MAQPGFAEDQGRYDHGGSSLASVGYVRLKIDNAGRIVIPAEMRAAMLVERGDTVTAQVVEGELRIISRALVMHRIAEEARRFKHTHPDARFEDDLAEIRREDVRLDEEHWARVEREAAAAQDAGSRG